MIAAFDRFEIKMTLDQARAASHPGPCDGEVAELMKAPNIVAQLKKILDHEIKAELKEYGAWSEEELKDEAANEQRVVWLAATMIEEQSRSRLRP